MQCYDIPQFLEHYAPCYVDSISVSECLENMCKQDEPIIEKDDVGVYRWLSLIDSTGEQGAHTEFKQDIVLKPLEKIIHSIQRYLSISLSLEIKSRRRDPMGVTLAQEYSIKQSFFLGETHYEDAIVIISEESEDDEHHQILTACRDIMDEDPRRMWIYGLTYRNNVISAWHFTRANSICVRSLNYHQEPVHLVALLLSFTSATPAQLGIDPLVRKCTRSQHDISQSYIYEIPSEIVGVPSTFYKTDKFLYQERRSSIHGRGTRVWEVTQVRSADGSDEINPKQHAILKDVWLDTDAPTEVETMDAIFKAVDDFVEAGVTAQIKEELKTNPSFDYNHAAMQRMLTEFIDADERFADFDDTVKRRLRGHLTNKHYKSFFLTNLHAWRGQTSQRSRPYTQYCTTAVNGSTEKFRFQDTPPVLKQQFRCVYKEVCSDLRAVGTLGHLMDVIDQALDALRILYCAGWVHRDISKGNFLVVEDGSGKWKLKLADFELSKQSGHGNGRIGTPYFMPHEVLTGRHLLEKHRECDAEDSLAVYFNLPVGSLEYQRLKDIDKNFCRRLKVLPVDTEDIPDYDAPVHYNFQHDLEALWWLVHYCITTWVDHQPSHDYAEFVFQKTLTVSAERNECFTGNFKSLGGRFLHPQLKVPFNGFMEKLRAAMYEEYVAREAFGQLHLLKSYSYIHNFFANQLRELLQHHDDSWKGISIACCSGVQKRGIQLPPAATAQDKEKVMRRARHKKLKRAHE